MARAGESCARDLVQQHVPRHTETLRIMLLASSSAALVKGRRKTACLF